MANETPFVQDLRDPADRSIAVVPLNLSYAELKAIFQFDVDRSQGWDATPPGDWCWKLVGIYLRTGVASYIHKVRKADGSPYPDILGFRHFSSAPNFSATPKPNYFPNGVGGFTNGAGDLGMPYSGGSAFGPNGGPDYFWFSANPNDAQPQTSDMLAKVGWHGATDHLTPNGIWQLTQKVGVTPSPSTGNRLVIVGDDGSEIGHINLLQGGGPTGQKRILLYQGGDVTGYALLSDPE